MNWNEIACLRPLKLNLGGKREHHPRRRWRGYVAVGLEVSNLPGAWAVSMRFPGRFELSDKCVDAVLSEHFFEHLTTTDAEDVMKEVRRVMKPGARFRIAVPDMLHPCYAQSLAAGRDLTNYRHQSIWTYQTLSAALFRTGFARIDLLHYWEEGGVFHERPINFRRHGHVKRCPAHDRRNRQENEYGELRITSLIVDAFTERRGKSTTIGLRN